MNAMSDVARVSSGPTLKDFARQRGVLVSFLPGGSNLLGVCSLDGERPRVVMIEAIRDTPLAIPALCHALVIARGGNLDEMCAWAFAAITSMNSRQLCLIDQSECATEYVAKEMGLPVQFVNLARAYSSFGSLSWQLEEAYIAWVTFLSNFLGG